jgi:hypothetical protein
VPKCNVFDWSGSSDSQRTRTNLAPVLRRSRMREISPSATADGMPLSVVSEVKGASKIPLDNRKDMVLGCGYCSSHAYRQAASALNTCKFRGSGKYVASGRDHIIYENECALGRGTDNRQLSKETVWLATAPEVARLPFPSPSQAVSNTRILCFCRDSCRKQGCGGCFCASDCTVAAWHWNQYGWSCRSSGFQD